jgi:hypothetical protein
MKMIWAATCVVLLLFSPTAESEYSDWSEREQSQYKMFGILQVIDTIQTNRLIRCQQQLVCGLVEGNPIIGPTPSRKDLFALKIIGNYVIYKLLDVSDDRSSSLKFLNGTTSLAVLHNEIVIYREF